LQGIDDIDAEEMSSDDPRLEFIYEFLSTTLKVKPDKWRKTMTTNENRSMVQNFFDDPSALLIMFSAPVSLMSICVCVAQSVQTKFKLFPRSFQTSSVLLK